jgi:hypothetical protein
MGKIEGSLGPLSNAGTPGNGTNEVQTLTIGGTPNGGTFKLTFDGYTTAAITWSATNNTLVANIQTALRALANIGATGVTVAAGSLSSGIGTITITFGGNLAKMVVPTITVALNSLTGSSPTLAVAETTPGVNATERGAAKGALLIDTTNAVLYINTGTALEPTWTEVGVITSAEVVAAMIGTDAVTGPKLASTALTQLVCSGNNGAGACTLTGAKVGDKVIGVINLTDAADVKASYESTITVADQIQQTSATDLSLKKMAVTLVVKS